MKKIVVQCIAKLQLGGAQKLAIDINREMENRGYIMSGPGGKLYSQVEEEFKERHICISHLRREINLYHDILCFFELRETLIQLYKKHGDIILHTHGSKAGVIGRLVAGTLFFCYSIHEIQGFAINPYINLIKRFIYINAERIASLFGDVIITVAQKHKNRALKWGIGKEKQYIHIPNAVEIDEFNKKEGKEKDKVIIGTIANFKPQKNPITWAKVAVKITDKYPGVEIYFAGDGPLKNKVERIVDYNDRIRLLGWKKNIKDLLEETDIYFLPSRWEGLPFSIIEAMAMEIPVVTSNIDGNAEAVIDDKTGFLVEPDDIEGYLKKLSLLIEDSQKRMEMGSEGRIRVEGCFSYKENIQKILNLYGIISKKWKRK